MKIKQTKLILGIFIVLILGFSITSYLSYSVTRDLIVNSAETQTLPLINDNIYSDIKADLIDPINVSSLMANDAFLISWVNGGEKNLPSIENYLGLIKRKYGYTSTFFVSLKTQNYYYSDGILKTLSASDAHDVWFYNFIQSGKLVDLEIDNDEAKNGLMTIFINHRLKDEKGRLLGVTGVGLELTHIAEHINYYEQLYNHKIYLVDHDGLVQIDSDRSRIGTANITQLPGIKDVSAAILSAGENVKIVEYHGVTGLVTASVRYIPEFNWYLIVEKDQESVLADAKHSMIRNLIFGGIIALVITIIIDSVIRKYNHRLELQASSDDLTKLLNRRAFMEDLVREVALINRNSYTSAILMIDIDDFKSINDHFGHYEGDALLVAVVNRIKDTLRTSDFMGRWGGDEFIVYLNQVNSEKAYVIAERIQNAVESQDFAIGDLALSRTVSIGMAFLQPQVTDIDEVICRADDALIEGKKQGKNRIEISE